MSFSDNKNALNHAIRYLTDAAKKRAEGGWVSPKEEERKRKEAIRAEEKQKREKDREGKNQNKLLSKQFPTQYMPEVGRQVMQAGGMPANEEEKIFNRPYDLGQQVQRGAEIVREIPRSVNRVFVEPVTSGIQELMRPVYEGGGPESYQNPEMVGRAIDVVGGLGAGSLLTGPSAAQTNVLRSGMGKATEDLFDFSRLHEVPKVQQFDLPRYEPARGVPARVTDVVANKDVQEKMLNMMAQGQKIGGANWYNADPLRDKFIEKLGADAGDAAFRKYMDLVAATSPRSKVGENARNASYYYQRLASGAGAPEVGAKNPSPYGHMAQRLHQMNVQRVAGEGWDPLNNPKPASFVENLVGNQSPVTVDTHAFRAPAILAGDPRFLETAYKSGKDTPPMNIQKMVERGEMSLEDAKNTPAFWQAQPKENEYGAMENYYKSLAQELGLTPAQTQASGWVGGAAMTGLGSDESKPFLRFFQDRVMKTAEELNMDPNDVLDKFIRGEIPLKARGGAIDHSELEKAENAGRNGDTMLAHINTQEAEMLKRMGGAGTINPKTGLPEFSGADPSGSSVTSSNYSGGASTSSYTGGSDLGGYSGSGNTSYNGGGGGGGSSWSGGGGRDSSPSIDRSSSSSRDRGPGLGFDGAEIMSPLQGISNGVPMFAPSRSQDQMLRALGIEGEVDKSGLPTPFRLGADIGTQYAREAVTPDFNVPNAQDLYAASNLPLAAELEAQKERDRIAAQNLAFNVGPSGKIIDRPDMRAPEQIDSTRRAINWGSTIGQGIANLGSMMSAQPEGITDPSIVARQNMPRNFDAPVTDYGAPNAPLAVNQNMGASNQERSQGPALEDIMGTRPQGEYLFSGMDISQKPIPRTYSVNPDEIAAQVRAKEPLAAFVGNDYILNEMRKQMPPDIQYENGRVSGFDVKDPETLANLDRYGISASSFKPVMQTSATTDWGSPSAGPYRSVAESGAEPQTFGSMYPLSPSTQQEQPSTQPASVEPRIGMPQLSQQPIQTSNAQQPMTVRENFDKAFSDARAQGKTTFQWTDPKTGILGTYTTQLARKAGGRVPSLKEPEQWIAKVSDISSVGKPRKTRKAPKVQGTAIVQRALMLSSRKS